MLRHSKHEGKGQLARCIPSMPCAYVFDKLRLTSLRVHDSRTKLTSSKSLESVKSWFPNPGSSGSCFLHIQTRHQLIIQIGIIRFMRFYFFDGWMLALGFFFNYF
jgi:hypothetical protein